jgi:hypothetical protein
VRLPREREEKTERRTLEVNVARSILAGTTTRKKSSTVRGLVHGHARDHRLTKSGRTKRSTLPFDGKSERLVGGHPLLEVRRLLRRFDSGEEEEIVRHHPG